jgi:DNA adenine methylase
MSEANQSPEEAFLPDTRLTPPLKWAGGKRWLIPLLRTLFLKNPRARLVEPFVGGMAVALGLQPTTALLNDINPHLINFYTQIQKGFSLTEPLENDKAFFYNARSRFNTLVHAGTCFTAESASLFYYMNRTAFNGLCRFNAKGEFNVPFGKYKTINYQRDFSAYRAALSQWRFSCGDFESLAIERSDFLYVDPPYDVPFTQYASQDFTWADQVRLVTWLASLPCTIVASNQATDRIIDLYQSHGFTIQILDAPRRISCTGDRRPAAEMFATKQC